MAWCKPVPGLHQARAAVLQSSQTGGSLPENADAVRGVRSLSLDLLWPGAVARSLMRVAAAAPAKTEAAPASKHQKSHQGRRFERAGCLSPWTWTAGDAAAGGGG